MSKVVGRFAPTPSGRMHMGNLFAALLAWLDVRAAGGTLVLRIEDLDVTRCPPGNAERLMDDLRWLGLDWDMGGEGDEWHQSKRTAHYDRAFHTLEGKGLIYPCYCTRAERLASSAPHREDGTEIYNGRCARLTAGERAALELQGRRPAWRVRVPEERILIRDGNCGDYEEDLARDCGDFIVRRSDGVYAYQLAVVADDGAMGVNHVVRGRDLLSSSPRQAWLHRELGYEPPEFFHAPLLLAPDGRRLAKRDRDLDMSTLREKYTPEQIIGVLAWWAGLLRRPEPVSAADLADGFSWANVAKEDVTAVMPL